MGEAANNLLLFVPAVYDDYGWTPDEFRILARIHRRCVGKAGEVGWFWESVPNLAKATNMSQSVVRKSLNVLEAAGAITRQMRPGDSTLIRFNTADRWRSADELPGIRKRLTPISSNRGSDGKKRKDNSKEIRLTPIRNDRGVGSKTIGVPLSETAGVPLSELTDEGIPSEGIPSEGNPTGGERLSPPPPLFLRIEELIAEVCGANPDTDPRLVETAVIQMTLCWVESPDTFPEPTNPTPASYAEAIHCCVKNAIGLKSAVIDAQLMAKRQKIKELAYDRKRTRRKDRCDQSR